MSSDGGSTPDAVVRGNRLERARSATSAVPFRPRAIEMSATAPFTFPTDSDCSALTDVK